MRAMQYYFLFVNYKNPKNHFNAIPICENRQEYKMCMFGKINRNHMLKWHSHISKYDNNAALHGIFMCVVCVCVRLPIVSHVDYNNINAKGDFFWLVVEGLRVD